MLNETMRSKEKNYAKAEIPDIHHFWPIRKWTETSANQKKGNSSNDWPPISYSHEFLRAWGFFLFVLGTCVGWGIAMLFMLLVLGH
jgi:hypothetical protein